MLLKSSSESTLLAVGCMTRVIKLSLLNHKHLLIKEKCKWYTLTQKACGVFFFKREKKSLQNFTSPQTTTSPHKMYNIYAASLPCYFHLASILDIKGSWMNIHNNNFWLCNCWSVWFGKSPFAQFSLLDWCILTLVMWLCKKDFTKWKQLKVLLGLWISSF